MSGSGWLKSNKIEMSKFGERVADLLGEVYDGIYHMDYNLLTKGDFHHKSYIWVTVSDGNGRFSTYDSDYLTRLVILAHVRNIRVSIDASTHGYLKLKFMKVDRNGFYADRHPTLFESIEKIEKHYHINFTEKKYLEFFQCSWCKMSDVGEDIYHKDDFGGLDDEQKPICKHCRREAIHLGGY